VEDGAAMEALARTPPLTPRRTSSAPGAAAGWSPLRHLLCPKLAGRIESALAVYVRDIRGLLRRRGGPATSGHTKSITSTQVIKTRRLS